MKKQLMAVLMAAALAAGSFAAVSAAEGLDPVTVEGGQLAGAASDTEGVTLYKGISFAASTVGENRWKAPQPLEE